MKNQALFSSKDKSKKLKCRLLQFLFGTLRVKILVLFLWHWWLELLSCLLVSLFFMTMPRNVQASETWPSIEILFTCAARWIAIMSGGIKGPFNSITVILRTLNSENLESPKWDLNRKFRTQRFVVILSARQFP